MRTFETGATRDTATNKPDYEGCFSPEVVVEYGAYMLKHQVQPDGNVRDSDNWQKGMPLPVYIKSLFRHFVDLWRLHRGHTVIDPKTQEPVTVSEACCAILFNTQGYLFEFLKKQKQQPVDNVVEALDRRTNKIETREQRTARMVAEEKSRHTYCKFDPMDSSPTHIPLTDFGVAPVTHDLHPE
jgi:hypothetical protein